MSVKIEALFKNNPQTTLEEAYEFVVQNAVDINEHCPNLVKYAKECSHVTEMGTRWGASTIAFLYAQPEHLVCYDWKKQSTVDKISNICGKTKFEFHESSTLEITIDETDLLFIDTLHTYLQLKTELSLHANKAKKYIILHDTATFEKKGQAGDKIGLGQAWGEFLDKNSEWKLDHHYKNNNGLTILRRAE